MAKEVFVGTQGTHCMSNTQFEILIGYWGTVNQPLWQRVYRIRRYISNPAGADCQAQLIARQARRDVSNAEPFGTDTTPSVRNEISSTDNGRKGV